MLYDLPDQERSGRRRHGGAAAGMAMWGSRQAGPSRSATARNGSSALNDARDVSASPSTAAQSMRSRRRSGGRSPDTCDNRDSARGPSRSRSAFRVRPRPHRAAPPPPPAASRRQRSAPRKTGPPPSAGMVSEPRANAECSWTRQRLRASAIGRPAGGCAVYLLRQLY
jgi:hypothetical protein